MRELEFRNTIDQYDLGIVLFFRKDVEECKKMLPGFQFAASKSVGKADFVAVSAKSAGDLCDELGVDTYPTIFSFRYGHLIEKLPEKITSKQLYQYVKNINAAKYKYVHDVEIVKETLNKHNVTLVVSMEYVDARMEKVLAVVSAKFFKDIQIVVATTPEVSKQFLNNEDNKFPSIAIVRFQDDMCIMYPNDPTKVTYKSLSNFVENNLNPRYELMTSFYDIVNELYFVALFDTTDKDQVSFAKQILEKVSADHYGKFKIRYADSLQMRRNLTILNLQNFSIPIFMFITTDRFGYHKYVFRGKPTPLSLSAFCSDQLRGRNSETIIDTPIKKPHIPLKYMTGSELKQAMETQKRSDFIVNFVGFPCMHCDEVDELFNETATWVQDNDVKNVVFARVNATCNDIPNEVWRNETFPYGWFFPANNRSAAFPIGKRRQLYWMVQLLVDNCTTPITCPLPPKPSKTPIPSSYMNDHIYSEDL